MAGALNIKTRKFLYHCYDDPAFAALPAWAPTTVNVPGASAGSLESKTMYGLKHDMDQLRSDGASKGIVDAGQVSLGKSHLGKDLWVLKVGKGSAHKILFTGCHHAREWISVEVPYLVAEYLIQSYTSTPSTPQEKRIFHLLENREIWFVPLVNPDGHVHTMTLDRTWRANRNSYTLPAGTVKRSPHQGGDVNYPAGTYVGVDVNRNYATSNWGVETFKPSATPPEPVRTSKNPTDCGANSIWCGIAPSGEPETKLIDALIQARKFRASITYHSFSQLLLYPDASSSDKFTQFVGKGMSTLIKAAGNAYTYESGSALYPTSGDAMEFAYEKCPGRPTFTPEVRPGPAAHAWPFGAGFSGLPESEIEPVFRENLGAALALINCAGFSGLPGAPAVKPAPGLPPGKAQLVRHCWDVFKGWTP